MKGLHLWKTYSNLFLLQVGIMCMTERQIILYEYWQWIWCLLSTLRRWWKWKWHSRFTIFSEQRLFSGSYFENHRTLAKSISRISYFEQNWKNHYAGDSRLQFEVFVLHLFWRIWSTHPFEKSHAVWNYGKKRWFWNESLHKLEKDWLWILRRRAFARVWQYKKDNWIH